MKRQRKSISCSFSTDLISEILLKLPEKSVVRFRCVSKFWLSVTTDSYFIKLFETRNPRPRSLLIFFKEDDEYLIVSSLPQHTCSLDQNLRNSYSCSQPIPTDHRTYRMKFPEFRNYWLYTNSVHGLICFQTSSRAVIVWNPSTSKLLTLPQPCESSTNIQLYLGYDPVEAQHKVIAMQSHITCRECRVITLGSTQESWRTVKMNQKNAPFLCSDLGQCIKGVMYYVASTYQTDHQRVWVIMRFDVKSEKLDAIQLPSNTKVNRLITYEGRLACVYRNEGTKKNGITLLILEDEEENKWSSKDFLAPYWHHDESLQIKFELKGFTHDGEFIYESYGPTHRHGKSLYALFFDPIRNSFRIVGFKGIAEHETRQEYIHMFPNHIESQMSL